MFHALIAVWTAISASISFIFDDLPLLDEDWQWRTVSRHFIAGFRRAGWHDFAFH